MTQTPDKTAAPSTALFLDAHMDEPRVLQTDDGEIAVVSRRSPDREPPHNEDAAIVLVRSDGLVLAVADGLGGVPGGKMAAKTAIETLRQTIEASTDNLREAIMNGVEQANDAVRGESGTGQTTLLVAEIRQRRIRTYNVGDSAALVVGQRGRIKLRTLAHSPVGYGVAAGLIGEEEAMHHEDRHYVSNTVGAGGMRIEVSAEHELDPLDTVVLGSDGLYDNLRHEEIAELVRAGPLPDAAAKLAAACTDRMKTPARDGIPSKPDDLTFILFRPTRD